MKLYSFDIFDTCLFRKVGQPENIFYKLGELIYKGVDKDYLIEEFVEARIQAEQIVRSRHPFNEPSIYEIWRHLSEFNKTFKYEFIELELKLEKENLLANQRILKKTTQLQLTGQRVLFISDTYFTKEFLLDILLLNGFSVSQNEIYCSNELGKSKDKGDLFLYVAEKEKCEFSNWTHFGDNRKADFALPKGIGIKAFLINDSNFNNIEKRLLDKLKFHKPAENLVQSIRNYRLANISKADYGVAQLVTFFLGPILLVLGQWILETARRRGIKKLYFCSRDARLLYETCKILSKFYPNIDCRYFYISRQACLLPATSEINKETLSWLYRDFEIPQLEILLNKLSLDYYKVENDLKEQGLNWSKDFIITKQEEKEAFWTFLQSDSISKIINKTILEKRNATLSYLNNIGIGEGNAAIVDLGWFKTVLDSINRILTYEDQKKVCGIYLGLHRGRKLEMSEDEISIALFYKRYSNLKDPLNSSIFSNASLLEHIFGICDHGTVLGYTLSNDKKPEVITQPISDFEINIFNKVNTELKCFINFFTNHQVVLPKYEESLYKVTFETLLHSFLEFPEKEVLEIISKIKVSSHQSNEFSTDLIKPISTIEAIKYFFGLVKLNKQGEIKWQKGRIILSNSFVQFICKLRLKLSELKALIIKRYI